MSLYPIESQVVSGCMQAAKWLKAALTLGSIGTFEQQLRLVHTLQQLMALATTIAAGSPRETSRLGKLRGAPMHPVLPACLSRVRWIWSTVRMGSFPGHSVGHDVVYNR